VNIEAAEKRDHTGKRKDKPPCYVGLALFFHVYGTIMFGTY
jgi:hypothetical protein